MIASTPSLTIALHHPHAEEYARLIGQRFPQVRTIVAPDVRRLEACISEVDAILAFQFPAAQFDMANKLRWFQSTGAGVDSFFPVCDRAAHVTVTNARGIHGELIADYVMAGATMLHWDFRRFLREQAEQKWNFRAVTPLAEMTLGVIGLGSIGATIARRAKSAGMRVVGSKRNVAEVIEGVDQLFGPNELDKLLPVCDFVVLAVPSTSDTVGLIGATELSRMRPSAFLINIARGTVIKEAELIDALQSAKIAGALLDVFEREPLPQESPLWTLPNVIVTPHTSGTPTDYTKRFFDIFAENIERYLAGQPLKNVVDVRRGY
ncbi:D-2-hydroxyacid dehydrogenase [Bradyrhizobium sp. CNPSo 4019]|uniref:D-2-hydroxyacid dehydrogenase n=2 Tax=Bradyrhizobium diversitatis TaxID=2755406 RepID=A0ABS0PG46_9BRAD|nr:D-2-hydroxyacid dehydrogenase [Bradyrhizobium diversitatis]